MSENTNTITISSWADIPKIFSALQQPNIVNVDFKADLIDKLLMGGLIASLVGLNAVMFKIYTKF